VRLEAFHILAVDDEPANVLLLQRVLMGAGFERVTTIVDSREVMPAFERDQPDLVLLDLNMPHIDGYQLLEQLRASMSVDDFVPVVVLTADATEGTKQRVLTLGANDFLTKPFDNTEVLLRIRNLLDTRSLHLRLHERNASLARELEEQREVERLLSEELQQKRVRIEEVIARGGLTMAFQPIVDLSSGAMRGMEALSRFAPEPRRTPDVWFAEAAETGLGAELELAAVHAAIAQLTSLPADTYLSVNLSPETLTAVHPSTLLRDAPGDRIVVEVTEHAAVQDYDALLAALHTLRSLGVRLAIDDAGAGFASLRHILRLTPEIIKLDLALTRDVDSDPVRRALATALVRFATDTGASIVAEGIETESELATLRDLGVACGQGYHIGRPAPLVDLL
jgi:EAL domain-containing protein (putative c-di-GMP-specific phosphodiesterase class I)